MLRSIWSISSLLIGMGLLLVGSGLLGMVIGLRGVYEGFSNLMIGLIMSGYYVGYIAGGWICPILIRRVGHVRCFASFAALSAALTLAFGMVVDPWVWLVLRVFNGLALMGIYMVIESWLNERSQATPGSQASIFAVYMVVNLATVAIGQYFVTFYGATAIESFIIAAILFCMGLLPIALAPVPQAALDDPASFLLAPIGNGPFKMDGKWESGQYIDVVRFDDYYGEKPILDGIHFSIQKDPATAFREFEAGNIDFCQIPSGRLNETSEKYGTSEDGYTVTPKKQVLTGAQAAIYYLTLNLNDPIMADINVRKAMSLAINRQNIVDTLFEGSRKAANGFFPLIIDDDESNVWEFCKYDKDAAQKIVDENNLAGTTITLSYNSGGGHEDIMSIVQGDLEAVGFKVEQSSMEWATYLTNLGDGRYQVGRLGWNADYPTMDNFLYPNFYSTADNNYAKYVNADVDAAIDAARQITDVEERKAAYRKINQTIAESVPVIPLMFYALDHVGSDRVARMYLSPQNTADLASAALNA